MELTINCTISNFTISNYCATRMSLVGKNATTMSLEGTQSENVTTSHYGVATISRLLRITGLFCRI